MFGLFPADESRSWLAGPAAHTSRLGIKIRGQSTRNNAKPSYSIELRGRASDDAPAALAGMPADSDWVLYAPFYWDRTMMHNVFAYDLSRKIGRYAPRTEYCEVFLVTEGSPVTMASYVGVYVLTERLTRSPDRIDVDKLRAGDTTLPALSGGYIVKADKADVEGEGFTAADLSLVYDEPSADDITPQQKTYITSYLDSCKRAVSASDGTDPITRRHYSELIDVPSFIDHHILNLLLKNPDAFLFSSYLHKPREGKLVAGPLWDFDRAMGTHEASDDRSQDPHYWGPNQESQMFRRSFWEQLFDHPEFAAQYWARLDTLLASTFTSANFRATVDALERQVSEAEARNRARWPESAPHADSYAEEVEALRAWLDARLKW
ncbi:MAG TPA: CotH kinase family protein, partial [Polyangiales bacterium]|nr:CotH kinase family protein [Polyangiales bacterium]